MKTLGKGVLFFVFMCITALYTTFVFQSFWNWFATEAFGVHEIGFWATYGIMLTIGLFAGSGYGARQ